ncbi:MAG: serine hydrolase [Myxococcales bacterium]|nr:serine hydrolase [Myxococcales bacterium]
MYAPAPVVAPSALQVVHVAGRASDEAVRAGAAVLERAGFEVRVLPAPGSGPPTPYLAADDATRRRALLHALSAPGSVPVVCARGGYGSMRTLRGFPEGVLADAPRWIVGCSDITALHLWAAAQGVQSIHGPMAVGMERGAADGSVAALLAALAGSPAPLPWTEVHEGTLPLSPAPLVGGNLTLLAALRATSLWRIPRGATLLIEDVSEAPYRLDRMVTSLVLSGLDEVAAVAIGQLTDCGDGALEAVVDALRPLGVPVVSGLPVGHGTPNLAFRHGATYRFDSARRALVWVPDALNEQLDVGAPAAVSAGAAALATNATPGLMTSTQAGAIAAPGGVAPRGDGVRFEPPRALLAAALHAGVCSGAQLVVTRGADVVLAHAVGATRGDGAGATVTDRTLFDVASVTKAIGTAIAAHALIAEGRVGLEDRCPAELSAPRPSLRELLSHASGLPAHIDTWTVGRQAPSEDDARRSSAWAFATAQRVGARVEAGYSEVYSDVGYVALGRWIEHLEGMPLADVFAARVAAPLTLSARFGPIADSDVAATEWCPYRGAFLQGVVHDENAQMLGGVAGHAGLFASALDVARIGQSLLGFGPEVLPKSAVERMWDRGEGAPGGSYTLGWDTPSGPRSTAGVGASRGGTFGHLGFTGCSVWIDRQRGVVVALNTNRVHPTRENATIRWLRPRLHDAVWAALGASA